MVCHQTSVGVFPPRRLLRPDEPRRHVRDPVDLIEVEGVASGVVHVPQEVVVLGGPAALRSRPVVVGPDDLVHERLAPEDLVQHHLAVVDLAEVDVEEEARVGGQGRAGRLDAVPEEPDVVVEAVVEPRLPEALGSIAPAPESDPVAVPVGHRAKPGPGLAPAGVERRVEVDEGEGFPGGALEPGEVLVEDDPVHESAPSGMAAAASGPSAPSSRPSAGRGATGVRSRWC